MKQLILLSVLLAPLFGFAQQYSVDWHTVAGGGGTSTGSVYSVSGTIGQPDASGSMTGGNYSLTGGFWALYALQTPGSPRLTITLTTGNAAIVSWPSLSTGFILQQNSNLTTTNWSNFGGATNDDGINKSVTINPPVGSQYFRLKQ